MRLLETEALCIYDINTAKFEDENYWRQLKHWNSKGIASFKIRGGKYFKTLAKGEVVGVVTTRTNCETCV